MSSTSFPESADSPSALSEPEDSALSPSARLNPTAEPSCASTGLMSHVSRMYEPSPQPMSEQSTLSAADSHARTSATQDTGQESTGNGQVCGLSIPGSFANYDRSAQSWRTSQHCLEGGLAVFSGIWPRSGMTRSGTAYQLPTLAFPTLGIASGLLPTIGANESKGSQRRRYRTSTEYRGAKMSEGLRSGESDPIYTHPGFAEQAMGFPKDWTLLETPSSRKSRKSSGGRSSKRKERLDD